VYTRKSSEEGLDMAFNSLDAQRQAGADYIASQRSQGWSLVNTAYDDGGYSGGSTDRPALQRLLGDIRAGRIDIVLVYKVDRLSRSLADFARLMQVFDEHHVSFVSVTQQFNTTTSMGRLTLNMLLSFAQFEREVAGERIRDKIAATKRRGVWVAGRPPLGYRLPRDGDAGWTPSDRTLRIVEPEAKLVRAIFDGYLATPSLLKLAESLNAKGHATRAWTDSKGASRGGKPLSPGFLHSVLTNPVYIGKITHKRLADKRTGPAQRKARDQADDRHGQVWPGLHEPIVTTATWERVHATIQKTSRVESQRWEHTHLLKGKLRTFEGYVMSPSSVQRRVVDATGKSAVRRIHYYTSQKAIRLGYAKCPIKSINAGRLDELVRALVLGHLSTEEAGALSGQHQAGLDARIRTVVTRVVLSPEELRVELDRGAIRAMLAVSNAKSPKEPPKEASGREQCGTVPRCLFQPDTETTEQSVVLTLRLQIKRHDGQRLLLAPDGQDLLMPSQGAPPSNTNQHIIQAIGLAYAWRRQLLDTGITTSQLAKRWGIATPRIHKLLPLTQLSPGMLAKALRGQMSTKVTLEDLLQRSSCLVWERHER
jgi:DNA invertase Pin-like site-specific DNA recombinase